MKLRLLFAAAAGLLLTGAACEPTPGVGTIPANPPSSSAADGPAGPAAGVVTVPAAIDATGATDVTEALTQFLATVPDGSTVVFPAGARYKIEGTVVVSGKHGVVLDGNGALLFAETDGAGAPAPHGLTNQWPRHRAHLYVTGSSDMTVRDFVIRGPHAGGGVSEPAYVERLEAQHAIEFDRVDGGLVEGNDIAYIYGDGVTIARASTDVLIRDNKIRWNGRHGVAVTGGERITIQDNYFDQIRRSVVDVEPNADYDIRTVRILDNEVLAARLSFVAALGKGGVFDDLEISGNHLRGMAMEIQVKRSGLRRTNITITNNVSEVRYGSTVAVIQLWGIDNATITGNTQPLTAGRRALLVEANDSCWVTVEGNTIPAYTHKEQLVPGGSQEVQLTRTPDCAGRTAPARPVR